MANALKGEAGLALHDGRQLTLRYDFDAFCEIEDIAGMTMGDVMEKLGTNPPLKVARAVLAGGLKHHHPELTLSDVGEIIVENADVIAGAMQKAMTSATGRPGAAAAAGPPKAPRRRGTGTRSSKSGAKLG